ncbi:hemerythrin domain-containing protein [Arenimonas sp.]|uniref:hemerythrin domain-containing protein n=1 Tax=Arenimonas sp. TaxID=1872635 RepID=UPI002E2FF62B|nr:hemerythrin domain-containing protein [Arenimonas sp.]HEX4853248.1 hemerythrin domain-containing protein [Arenimonas sp.]
MARDILKTLKAEHNALRELFKEMESTTDRAEKGRADLLAKIEAGLVPHAKWEEQVFYPAFKERADRDGLKTLAEALLEHASVEQTVIPHVKGAAVTTPEFAGRMKVFGEFVDHHAKEEESTMFKMAREMFSADELAQLDEDYETWKASPAASNAIAGTKLKTDLQGAAKKVSQTLSG